jgi:hypothetical protein
MVKQRSHKASVVGSIPTLTTNHWIASVVVTRQSPKLKFGVRFPGDLPYFAA